MEIKYYKEQLESANNKYDKLLTEKEYMITELNENIEKLKNNHNEEKEENLFLLNDKNNLEEYIQNQDKKQNLM